MSRFDIPEGSHHLVVGGSPAEYWEQPSKCSHSFCEVCPECAALTDDEVAALRKYFALLKERQERES